MWDQDDIISWILEKIPRMIKKTSGENLHHIDGRFLVVSIQCSEEPFSRAYHRCISLRYMYSNDTLERQVPVDGFWVLVRSSYFSLICRNIFTINRIWLIDRQLFLQCPSIMIRKNQLHSWYFDWKEAMKNGRVWCLHVFQHSMSLDLLY